MMTGYRYRNQIFAGTALAIHLLLAGAAAEAQVAPPPAPIDVLVQRPSGVDRAKLELRRLVPESNEAAIKAVTPDGDTVYLANDVILTEQDVTEAHVTLELDLVHYAVTLHFAQEAAARLERVTGSSYGSFVMRLAILINGQVLATPTVNTPLSDTAMLSGGYTRTAATQLAEQLAP